MNRPLHSTACLLALLSFVIVPFSVRAERPQTLTIQIYGVDNKLQSSFKLPSANDAGGASLALGDLGTDGVPEIVIGMGLGNEPRVHILRKNGTEISSFLAYDKKMGLGVNVAVCDIDGDGTNEIVTAAQRGGGPHIRLFTNTGAPIGKGWFAYAPEMKSGVDITCADTNHDGRAELVTRPALGGEPRVKIWNGPANEDGELTLVRDFIDDGSVHDLDSALTSLLQTLTTKTASAASNVAAATADFDRDGIQETVTVPARPAFDTDRAADPKSIVVDLSEQRLYAYEYGILTNTFLVSTARAPFKTPLGARTVTEKVLYVNYKGGTGRDAYDLGIVKWNLRFAPHIYIHYAPWHNNFGYTMSHGCVNVRLDRMMWTYAWAEKETPIIVQE